ncbi:carboxypeptidase-like regulatory domain-containing protein [Hymenobacter sp. NST-14]|uniref:carboxypeptidase-like regulatory domain-containing protein n=1 Tax=Hymenobacter piscis TaxID=2839984 RepID=UPI001C017DEF|nr:carboxypeptidase-like regulatory domain-containing protein [Hymenobacter piscis]MBT9392689.1 carboxypeptidase-like regulatory domain-containing protein [Hymenobacter piscis]
MFSRPSTLRRWVTLLILLLLPLLTARAQAPVSGVVLDSVTRQPLPFGTVFLANTTLGTTTDEAGRFRFGQVPAGRYEVVASYLGYQLRRQPLTVTTTAQELTFRLPPAANALGEVVIRPHANNPDDYRKFADTFLGSTTFSRQCRIRNPAAVRVEYDAQTNELTATCPDFLTVENRALGYRIRYYGLEFRLNFAEGWTSFYGSPVFEPLRARSRREQQRWDANRQRAYQGSLPHFLRSVHQNQVGAAGFRVQRLRRVPNPARPRADSLIALMRAGAPASRLANPARFDDSLAALLQVPRQLEYLFTQPLSPADYRHQEAGSGAVNLQFPDLLVVAYEAEPADPAYVAYTARQAAPGQRLPAGLDRQESVLHLLHPSVPLQPNGLPEDPLALLTEGYWGFEKMGEFLPVDYQPPPAPGP